MENINSKPFKFISFAAIKHFMKDYIIIGAGQSGLAIAYYLHKQNVNYLVLDANTEIGAPWLKRWDSLKLFNLLNLIVYLV